MMYEKQANAQLFLSKWESVHVNVIRAIELIMQIFRRSTHDNSTIPSSLALSGLGLEERTSRGEVKTH
jgi:hypothetical protein